MVIYDSVRSIMNTTENMEHLIINTRYDGTTLQYQGVDWFQFNGKVISNIYVSDNSFIGLGNKTEHLLVCRRDASLYNFYREEGSLFGTIRFLKLRWEGYAQYNNTTEDVRLVYEWFFFETGDMFLNLIKAPNAAGYLGTSRINGSMNQDFAVTVTQQQYISFFHKDNSGKKFDISYSVIDFAPPFESKYLLADKAGRFYRLMHNKAFVDSIVFKGGQCIRTGLMPGNDMRLSVSFKTSTFGNAAIFGARTDEKTDMFGVFLTDSKHITCVYGGLNITEEVDDYRDILITLELSKDGLKRDGITIMTFDNAEFTSSCELIIGTMNTADQLDSRYFMGTVYSIDLWQGEEQRLHLVPCVDEQVKPCFYNVLTDSSYQNSGFNEFEFEDENLEYDKSSYIEEVPVKKLNSAAFRQYGFDDFPRNVIFSKLTNPVLYHWQNTDIDLPPISAKITAIPPVQLVYSKNTEMNDNTILGIESVEIDSDDNTLFAFSFDCGSTWKAYTDGRWMTLSEETSGMNRESVKAVGTDAWNEAAAVRQYKIRFALREGGYVNRITVHYLN